MESSWPVREVEDDRARSAPLPFECERPRPSSALLRVREREERPPIIELRDIRPNEPDVRDGATSGVWPPLVEEAVEEMRSSPFESACCFVSTFEEDHLEKRGVEGREEAGEELSDMEFVREVGTMGVCWEADVDEGRLATEEETE